MVILLISAFFPLGVFSDNETEYLKGTVYLIYDFPAATRLEVGDIKILPSREAEDLLNLSFSFSGIDSKGSKFYLNGKELGDLSAEGSIELTKEILNAGKNEIIIRLVTNSGSVYNENLVYGQYNLDDVKLNSLAVTDVMGNALPLTLVKYLPVEGKAGTTKTETTYNKSPLDIGDGWNAATGLGGSTPNVPVMAGFSFDYSEGGTSKGMVYEVDTTLLPEGENEIRFYNTESNSYYDKSEYITVNNKAPGADFGFQNGGIVYKGGELTVEIKDSVSGLKSAEIYLDDKKIKTVVKAGMVNIDTSALSEGRHTIYAYTLDRAGNKEYFFSFFTLAGKSPEMPVIEGNIVSGNSNKTYGVKLVKNINMFVNPMGDFNNAFLRNSYEESADFGDLGNITTTALGNSLPYQSFLIDVSGFDGKAVVSCTAETDGKTPYIAAAWNYKTSKWDALEKAESGESITVEADIPTYSKDGKMRINIYPDLSGNGSDTILWHTDTQYYTRYDDLNFLYKSIMDYAAGEYNQGNIAYVLFTGDFVDQMSSEAEADKEFGVASEMQKILDDAGVPNGVLAGNHDTRHTGYDYSYYVKYFPRSRYDSNKWYGGSLDNNINHFDLVTVGGYNFIIIYLSYGREADDKTVAWANQVLETYSNYNAIIATHEYLLASGVWSATSSKNLWEKIVVPNENVKMILCGHNEGVSNRIRKVEGTGREVLEILHDYQFAEINQGPKHIENGYTCDGESFLRLLTFNNSGQMIMSTYSPYYDINNYFSPYEENFVYSLDLIENRPSIKTTFFEIGVNPMETQSAEGFDGFYSADDSGRLSRIIKKEDFKHNKYYVNGDKPRYNIDETIIKTVWYSGISPTLSNSAGKPNPAGNTAEMVQSLLPDSSNQIRRTSGSTEYKAEVTEDGKVVLGFTRTDSTWISVTSPTDRVNLAENPCVYFSVTARSFVKWNISINTNFKTIYFSQYLYRHFGYFDYAVASDIRGSWQGFIDLSEYLTPGEAVSSIYLVNASRDEEIVFDYLFIGKPTGVNATFVLNDNTSRRIDIPAGDEITPPDEPYINGKAFEGWFFENGEKAEFPLKLNENAILYAKFIDKVSENDCIYYDTETEFAELIDDEPIDDSSESKPLDKTDGLAGSLPYIIAGIVIVIIIAVVIIVIKKKKIKS